MAKQHKHKAAEWLYVVTFRETSFAPLTAAFFFFFSNELEIVFPIAWGSVYCSAGSYNSVIRRYFSTQMPCHLVEERSGLWSLPLFLILQISLFCAYANPELGSLTAGK